MPKEIIPQLQPTLKQHLTYEKLRDDVSRFVLFGGGAGGGKSWLGCEWLITNCYLYPGSKWFMGRKELKRLMASTYITFRKVCKYHQIPDSDWKLNGQYNYIEFVEGAAKGSRIDLLDLKAQPSDPLYERFGSLEYTGGWIEEAGEVDFLCFDVLKSRIGRHLNSELGLVPPKLLLTCNPTQNWLYRIFYKPWKEGTLSLEYAFIRALYNDNPYTAEEYGKTLSSITDPILRARLKEGLWEYDSDGLNLMEVNAIYDLFTNALDYESSRYLSADVARFGSDRNVLGAWQGMDLYRVEEKTKQGTDTTEQDIRDILTKEMIPFGRVVVDENGVGGGVVDHLKGVRGFVGGRSPLPNPKDERKENYRNLRSQCYFVLADKVNHHQIKISAFLTETQREMLIEELQQIKRIDTSADEPLQVVAKEEIKEALGRSPDFADMLMMRMFFEVAKPTPEYRGIDAATEIQKGNLHPFGGVGW